MRRGVWAVVVEGGAAVHSATCELYLPQLPQLASEELVNLDTTNTSHCRIRVRRRRQMPHREAAFGRRQPFVSSFTPRKNPLQLK